MKSYPDYNNTVKAERITIFVTLQRGGISAWRTEKKERNNTRVIQNSVTLTEVGNKNSRPGYLTSKKIIGNILLLS